MGPLLWLAAPQRFMAIEGESSIPAGRSIGTIWIALMYTTAVVLGVIALPALTGSA